MNLQRIRRLYLKDHEWERTSSSWKELIPLRDFDHFSENEESPLQYRLRLLPRFDIPLDVVEQWLYLHYYNKDSVNNYGWLDYEQVRFEMSFMSVRDLARLHIIEEYKGYVKTRQTCRPFEDFVCTSQDLKHWKVKGTWRVPPIVIDVRTLRNIPDHAELRGPVQLVEGHSRLGYLLAMCQANLVTHDSNHRVYRMYLP